MEEISEALSNGGGGGDDTRRAAQLEAAVQISSLKTRERLILADKGIIVPLVDFLVRSHGGDDTECVQASLFALLALASGSERNKIRMVKSGVVPVLLRLLLISQSDALIELSAVAMLILSSCSVNRSAIASSSGAIQALISVLDGERHGTRAKLDAVATLHNLSSLPQTMAIVISSGGVSSLVQLLIDSDKSSEMAEKVTALLEIAVLSSSDSLEKEMGAIHAVVEVVEEGTAAGREHAVAVLLQVCRSRRDVYRETIVRAGAAPALLQLGADGGSRRGRKMARELLRLLREEEEEECSEFDTKPEFMEKIMREIDAEGEIVVGATLRLVEEMIAKMRHEPFVIDRLI